MKIDLDEFEFKMKDRDCEMANLPKRFYEASYRNVTNTKGKKFGYDYILDFKTQEKNIVIAGDVCTGKTTLAVAMLKQLIIAGRGKGFYVSFPDILNLRKENRPIHAEDPAYTFWGECNDSDLLVVDNLGVEVFSTFTKDDYLHILNSFLFTRFDNNKKTVFITSIVNPEGMGQRYGEFFSKSLFKKSLVYKAE